MATIEYSFQVKPSWQLCPQQKYEEHFSWYMTSLSEYIFHALKIWHRREEGKWFDFGWSRLWIGMPHRARRADTTNIWPGNMLKTNAQIDGYKDFPPLGRTIPQKETGIRQIKIIITAESYCVFVGKTPCVFYRKLLPQVSSASGIKNIAQEHVKKNTHDIMKMYDVFSSANKCLVL